MCNVGLNFRVELVDVSLCVEASVVTWPSVAY